MSRKKGRGNGYHHSSNGMYWQTNAYNEQLFQMLRDDIVNLAYMRFRYVGLPDTCDARYLESALIFDGQASIMFPREKPGAWMSLKAVARNQPNMYGYPTAWRTIGSNGKAQYDCDWSNGVFLYDSMTRYPLITKINIWARELADIIRVKQINRFHQRIPFGLKGPKDKQFDMTNMLKQISNGELAYLATDGISAIETDTFQTGVQFLGGELQTEYENTWNSIYRMLGIRALPFKSERRIEDEVTDTMEPTDLSRMSPLMCRRSALDKINARFGRYLNEPMQVFWNEDIESDNFNLVHDWGAMMGDDSR